MVKKAFLAFFLLVIGFAVGGGTFYLLDRGHGIPSASSVVHASGTAELPEGRAFSGIVRDVSPSVVNIATVHRVKPPGEDDPLFDFYENFLGPFGETPKGKEQGLGSGVIVSPEGYIVTNYHVVSGAEKIQVTLFDKRVLAGKVIGADPKTDIAVVKISSGGLPMLEWGDSDGLRVGEFVLAIGNPFGLNHTVTMGIVSAVGRANVGIADYEDFIQTDAAINPGNSGGPLVNADGRLIGINTAIFSKSGGYQGIGFAVPSNMARLVMEQLLKEGKVTRGWLGVTIQELTPELGKKFGYDRAEGVLVVESMRGGPAEKAGLRRGDIILQYEGKEIDGSAALKNMAAKTQPGSTVAVSLLRAGKRIAVMVKVEELPTDFDKEPEPDIETPQSALSGLRTTALTDTIARQLGLSTGAYGVVVVGVVEGCPAFEAGLRRGDVIMEINNRKVIGPDELADMTDSTDETVLIFVNRAGKKFYLTIQAS